MLLRVPALPNLFVYLLFISLSVPVFKAKLIKQHKTKLETLPGHRRS